MFDTFNLAMVIRFFGILKMLNLRMDGMGWAGDKKFRIYSLKLSPTSLWVSKLDIILGVRVKNIELTFVGDFLFWSESMIPNKEYQITYACF